MVTQSSAFDSNPAANEDLNMETVLKRLGRNKLTSDSSDPDPGAEIDNEAAGPDDVMTANDGSDEEDNKNTKISIDITKALVILGFSNWSELDLGKYAKTGYIYIYIYIYYPQIDSKLS